MSLLYSRASLLPISWGIVVRKWFCGWMISVGSCSQKVSLVLLLLRRANKEYLDGSRLPCALFESTHLAWSYAAQRVWMRCVAFVCARPCGVCLIKWLYFLRRALPRGYTCSDRPRVIATCVSGWGWRCEADVGAASETFLFMPTLLRRWMKRKLALLSLLCLISVSPCLILNQLKDRYVSVFVKGDYITLCLFRVMIDGVIVCVHARLFFSAKETFLCFWVC